MEGLRIRRAEVEGEILDVVVTAGRISHLGGGGPRGLRELDAAGCAVLPGLHDHHVHLLAMSAARRSIDVAEAVGTDAFDRAMTAASVGAEPHEWLRLTSYHEALHGPLDRHRLDRLAADRPVRVQHATGAMWVLSTPALHELGLADLVVPAVERDERSVVTGRIFGGDQLVRRDHPELATELALVGAALADRGVTGVTDLTPTEDPASLALIASVAHRAEFPVDVVVTGGPGLDPDAVPELARGPVKLMVGDHDLPDPDRLAAAMVDAHAHGRSVACHCASAVGLAVALAAWEAAGAIAGDRIEHGAVVPRAALARVKALGLIVVTQPAFVHARGDRYQREVPADERDDLWRCGTLIDAGIGVAAGSDAPYGPLDPWLAIATAVDRRSSRGVVIGATDRVDAAVALSLYLGSAGDPAGPRRRIEIGRPARLCVLDRPLSRALDAPAQVEVVGTFGRAGWRPTGS